MTKLLPRAILLNVCSVLQQVNQTRSYFVSTAEKVDSWRILKAISVASFVVLISVLKLPKYSNNLGSMLITFGRGKTFSEVVRIHPARSLNLLIQTIYLRGREFFDEGDLEQKQYTFTTMYKKLIISATSIPFIKSVEHKTFICWLFPFFVCVNET